MDKTFVVWKSYHKPEVIDRGYWDNGILEDSFRDGNFEHVYDVDEVTTDGAIFIINGRTHTEDYDKINADIAKLRWVLFIITGDEEASFNWREIHHPIMRMWVMLPRVNEHNDVSSLKLPNGSRPNTYELLKEIGVQPKVNDFFFVGQVNHPRRDQCVEAIKQLQALGYSGVLIETQSFGASPLEYREYLRQMASSKIVLCPSGIESPDNFRLYEALECGTMPVADAFSTNHQFFGFWKYLFNEDVPFPILDYWDALPKLMPQLMRDYPRNANRAFAWWQQKKRAIKLRIESDVKELSK